MCINLNINKKNNLKKKHIKEALIKKIEKNNLEKEKEKGVVRLDKPCQPAWLISLGSCT
jgi:hypothetical protein